MKKFLLMMCVALFAATTMFAKSDKQTVIFDVDLHCQGCVTKIEKNIAFEKGVKDLVCNLQNKTVTVTFDPAKTSVEALQKAFQKIGKPATVHKGCPQCKDGKCTGKCHEGQQSQQGSCNHDHTNCGHQH